MVFERLSLDLAERLSAPAALRFAFPPPPGPAAAAVGSGGRGAAAAAGGSVGRGAAAAAGGWDGREPAAFLSLRSEGDMRFVRGGTNPNRERFFAGMGLDPAFVLGLELSHSRGVAFPLEEAVLGAPRGCPDAGANGSAANGSFAPAARAEAARAQSGCVEADCAEAARAQAGCAEARCGEACDGILLRDPAYAASVTVADCMPIWLLDRASGAFGVLHSGWKGTGILERALAALRERYGTGPASVSVILGPAIGPCCYAVPEERALGFAREFGAEAAPFAEGQWRLDLRAANIALARRLGVGALLSVEACTSCEESLGSFRRQGPEAFTRMVALAAFPPRLAAGRGPS